MARFEQRPLTDAEIESLREELDEQRDDIQEFLEGEGVDVSGWEPAEKTRADGGDE